MDIPFFLIVFILCMLNILILDSIIVITPDIIKPCTKQLKPGKDDGDISFKSDHLLHGVINCMLYCLSNQIIFIHTYKQVHSVYKGKVVKSMCMHSIHIILL